MLAVFSKDITELELAIVVGLCKFVIVSVWLGVKVAIELDEYISDWLDVNRPDILGV